MKVNKIKIFDYFSTIHSILAVVCGFASVVYLTLENYPNAFIHIFLFLTMIIGAIMYEFVPFKFIIEVYSDKKRPVLNYILNISVMIGLLFSFVYGFATPGAVCLVIMIIIELYMLYLSRKYKKDKNEV